MLKRIMRGWVGIVILGAAGGAFAAQSDPESNSRHVIQGETVYDTTANLTWQRCSVGQQWIGATGCTGVVKTFAFEVAQQQGGGIWRVPTKDELAALVDQGRKANKQKPTIDVIAFPDMDPENLVYWSSTHGDTADAWFVSFDSGYIFFDYRTTPRALRLVHSGH